MKIQENFSIKDLNSLRVNQLTRYFCSIETVEECKEAIEFSISKEVPCLFIGEGSNIVFTKDYDGLLIKNNILGKKEHDSQTIEIFSGENWHNFVDWTISNQRYGLENLALIPGTVGAAPIQNIGAYGKEVSSFIDKIKTINTITAEERIYDKEDCEFAYRSSVFQNQNDLFISSVIFVTSLDPNVDVSYDSLKKYIKTNHKEVEALTPKDVFNYVSALRRNVLPDHNKEYNVGSFFKNLILREEEFKNLTSIIKVPFYKNNSLYKVPSAFLIERAGWKGKGLDNIRVSNKHSLVLTTTGNLKGKEVIEFANLIVNDIHNKFEVKLEVEPTLI